MEVDVMAVGAIEGVSEVNFHQIAYANAQQRSRNVALETPGVVVDHAGSNFVLGFANGPMDHFAALVLAREGRRNVGGKGPTGILAGQLRLGHKDELALVLFLLLFFLGGKTLGARNSEAHNQSSQYNKGE